MNKIIFSDFDGTLTDGDSLGPIFFSILEEIEKNGDELVVVTGRSLSWGHFLLTHFPMKACIVEGGGIILRKEGDLIVEKVMVGKSDLSDLEEIYQKLIEQIPGCPISADSFGRKSDRAIDLNLLTDKMKEKILSFLYREKAAYYLSNVHLNFWKGSVSKANAVTYFLGKYRQNISVDDCIYFGDSRNDQSMFELIKHSVGVSNISSCWDDLKIKPAIRLNGDENRGPYGVYNYLSSLK